MSEFADSIPETAWHSVAPRPGPGAEVLCVLGILATAAERSADVPALISLTECITYAALLSRVRAVAHAVSQAIPPDAGVATLLPQSPAGIAAILGCVASGRVCIPLNASEPAERLALLLEDAAPALVLAPGSPAGPPCLDPATLPPAPDNWQPPRQDPDSPATVHFTSGSSGRPKGTVLSHYAVLRRGLHYVDACRLVPGDRMMGTTPATIGSGLSFVIGALIAGATVAVTSLATEGANAVLTLAARERVTVLMAPAPILRLLCALPAARHAFSTLRHIRTGAISLASDDVRAVRAQLPPGCAISHAYASTEALEIAQWTIPPGAEGDAPNVAAGFISPGQHYVLLDDAGRPVPDFTPGEMVLRSRHIALGDWRQGQIVQGRMRPDPTHPGWRVFRTGDIMRLDPTGLLRFIGRADRQIKINGVRIEPAEIETVLRGADGVTDAAVVADNDGRLHAFVATAGADPRALRPILTARLRAGLPSALRPAHLTVLPALPLLPSGKTDLLALRRIAATVATPSSMMAPTTRTD